LNFTLSIVIPVKNGARYLPEWKRALEMQRAAPAFEVIAVDSGSSDSTPDLLEQLGVKVLKVPPGEFGHARTRNLAIAAAAGDLVLMTVQDAVPASRNFLSAITRPFFENTRLAGVRARQVPGPETPLWAAWLVSRCPAASAKRRKYSLAPGEDLAQMSRKRVLDMCGLDFVASCIRRDIWQKTALPEIGFGEDKAWTAHILEHGWAWLHEPDAVVMHAHSRPAMYSFKRAYIEERANSKLPGREPMPPFLLNAASLPLGIASLARDVPWYLERSGGLPGAVRDLGRAGQEICARSLGAFLADIDLLLGRGERFKGQV